MTVAFLCRSSVEHIFIMPIVNNILTSAATVGEFEYPTTPLGDFIEQVIKENVAKFGDTIFMKDATTLKSLTYGEFIKASRQIASGLKKRGFQAGDSVILMASNHVHFLAVLVGAWKCGGSISCLTLNLLPEDVEQRMGVINPKFIFTDRIRAARLKAGVKNIRSVQEIFSFDNDDEGCSSIDQLLLDDGKDCPEGISIDENQMAWLMFSSGTTGVPKGIVYTYKSVGGIAKNYSRQSRPNTTMLFINLMINSGGLFTVLWVMMGYASSIVISDYSDDNLLRAIHEHKPRIVSMFPSQIAWICRHPDLDKYNNLESVFSITCGGSRMIPDHEKAILAKLPNLKVLLITYGLSEVGGITATPIPDLTQLLSLTKEEIVANRLVGSCGKVVPFCKLKVIDRETGALLGPGQVGEVCVSSPYMLREYLNNPKETAHALKDGWFHTGDEGYYDAEENVFVLGRYKELVKYRMAHVVPTNIEKHLVSHPAVADAAVVGFPHEIDGEHPMAFVVLKDGHQIDPDEIPSFIAGRVIDEEKLRGGVRFVDSIPRNDFGKIMRRLLLDSVLTS